jgi:hypothetical protein
MGQVDGVFVRTRMKYQIALFAALLGTISTFGQMIITPTAPVVTAGSTLKFKASTPVAWSVTPGSQGSIDQDGTYRAPASITAQHSYGGCQVLPNNHVFNTRVDSLPLNLNSTAWVDAANSGSVFYTADFPINYVNGSTPTQNLIFHYTPSNNGSFKLPAHPDIRVQSGYFAALGRFDKHVLAVSPATCTFQEIYNLYEPGYNNQCARCTATSGVQYSSSSYALPTNGATNAAGTYIIPLTLHLQEVEQALATGGSINHALSFTLKNSHIARSFIWPATSNAYAPWGIIPYGARFRLKSAFDVSTFSVPAQLLLTQLKQYGLILTDGGSQWEIGVEYTKWPPSIQSAFAEIRAAVKPTDMEAVDESSLMILPASGNTREGGETVIATSIAHPDQKMRIPVVLTGVTVNLAADQKYIQVGAPAQQFMAFVSGTNNTAVTWSLSPAVGTLSSDGLYTPPESLSSPQEATVRATSVADSSISAQMALTVFPAGIIRIALGSKSPLTDKSGAIWFSSTGYDQGGIFDNGWIGPVIPLYRRQLFAGGDMRFEFGVPNGVYRITSRFASTNAKAPGKFSFDIESQGQKVRSGIDLFVAAGGEYKPVEFADLANVTNNQLSYVLRHVDGENMSIAAIQIEPVTSSAAPSAQTGRLSPPSSVNAIVKP